MRLDTARYPLATCEYRPLLSAIDRFPISPVVPLPSRRAAPRSSLDWEQPRDVQPAFNDTDNYEVSFLGAETGPIRLLPKIEKMAYTGRGFRVSVEFNL